MQLLKKTFIIKCYEIVSYVPFNLNLNIKMRCTIIFYRIRIQFFVLSSVLIFFRGLSQLTQI